MLLLIYIFVSILIKFEQCTYVWCLCMCYWKCYQVTHLNISANWSQIFTKLSAYFRIGILSWLIIFLRMHLWACMILHDTFVPFFFANFVVRFCNFEAFSDWKCQNRGHTPGSYQYDATFYCHALRQLAEFWCREENQVARESTLSWFMCMFLHNHGQMHGWAGGPQWWVLGPPLILI